MADQNDTIGMSDQGGVSNEAAGVPSVRENLAPRTSTPAPTQQKGGSLNDDISRILQDVKLPERREVGSQMQIENKAALFDTALGVSAGSAAAVPEAPPQQSPRTPGVVTPVHTLKDDLQHIVQDQKLSVVRAASLEQDRRTRDVRQKDFEEEPVPVSHYGRRALLTATMLILLGGGALGAVYAVMQRKSAPPPQIRTSSILFSESTVPFSIDNQTPQDLKNALGAARATAQGALGSITQIVPTTSTTTDTGATQTQQITFAKFMKAIGAHAPAELLRALSDTFFFGIHMVDKSAPVIIVPVVSYDHAFAGMLAWEPTMNSDLAPIFTAVPSTTLDKDGLPVDRTFQDVVMRNYDVRVLKDDAGTIQLYYSFPSQHVLIIAESPYSFVEILSRLQAARQL